MIRVTYDGRLRRIQTLNLLPRQVRRAIRNTANKITREYRNEIGKEIAVKHKIKIGGFKRVRARKKLAKARGRRGKAVTWIGENSVSAHYGKFHRQLKDGIKVGDTFFRNGFKLKGTGFKGVFKRVNGKLVEQKIPLDHASSIVDRKVNQKRNRITEVLKSEIAKELARGRR